MQGKGNSGGDWQDAQSYAPLLQADRALVAWEWLRRDPAYCVAARSCRSSSRLQGSGAGLFGLVAFEPPDVAVPQARPLWRTNAYPYVLWAELMEAAHPDDVIDFASLDPLAKVVLDAGQAHLLLSDGFRYVRLDGPPGTFKGPAGLRYQLHGMRSAERPLVTLQRFLSVTRRGAFQRSLHGPEPRARRWILQLRAHDALAKGTSQREIATVLLGGSAGERNWRIRQPSIRSQVQRLVRSARLMASGGWQALLS